MPVTLCTYVNFLINYDATQVINIIPVMKKIKKCKKGRDEEKVKKQGGMSTMILNYRLENKINSYLRCSNGNMDK